MVEFLMQDDVSAALLSFITQVNSNLTRPQPKDDNTEELKLAYKATMLLTSDEPSEGLIDFLGKRAKMLIKLLMPIFDDSSAGSFFHAYRIFELLLRHYPSEVFEALCDDGNVIQCMTSMLRYVGYAPISELLVVIVGLSPIARGTELYTSCEAGRWEFIKQISSWNFLLRVAEIIVKPEEICNCNGYVDGETHSLYASQLFQDSVEKLSIEDIGELLLQPIGYTPDVLRLFIDAITDPDAEEYTRRHSAKILYFLCRRAADPEILLAMGPMTAGAAPVPICVPNRLFALRQRIIALVGEKFPDIISTALKYDPSKSYSYISGPVSFSSYIVKQPFTTLRINFVELVVIMIESDENMANHLTQDIWKHLIEWCIQYAHNNVYHALFYRIVFAVLRQNQESAQRVLFQKSRFLSWIIDTFLETPFKVTDDGILSTSTEDDNGILQTAPPRKAPKELVDRFVLRSLVMNCAHATRLQAITQPPTAFIRQFLGSHSEWQEFQPKLIVATENQHRFGGGISIVDMKPTHNLNSLLNIMDEDQESKDVEGGIEHGSMFAKNLGFYEDADWSDFVDEESNDTSVDSSRSSRHSLNLSDDLDGSSDGHRLSGDVLVGGGAFSSPSSRIMGGSLFFGSSQSQDDADDLENSDIVDGITPPKEALETRRRKSLEKSPEHALQIRLEVEALALADKDNGNDKTEEQRIES